MWRELAIDSNTCINRTSKAQISAINYVLQSFYFYIGLLDIEFVKWKLQIMFYTRYVHAKLWINAPSKREFK